MLSSLGNTFGCASLFAHVSARFSRGSDRLGLLIELQRTRPKVEDAYRPTHGRSETFLFTGILTRERYNGVMKNAPVLR